MIETLYRTAFFWILFTLALSGRNWVFPYGVKGALASARDYRASQISRQNHFPLHALNR